MNTIIYFKLEYLVQTLILNTEPVIFTFNEGGNIGIVFEHKDEHQQNVMQCEAILKVQASQSVFDMFKDLIARRLPNQKQIISVEDKQRYLDENGFIKAAQVIPVSLMPEPFRDFTKQAHDRMFEQIKRILQLIRWRKKIAGNHNPISSFRGHYWSFDNVTWHPMPHSLSASMEIATVATPITEQLRQEIITLTANHREEPLAHELFREAWEQRRANIRSALVMGIAALEIGVKRYIAERIPDARWLVENLPSPSVVGLLTEYLPKIQSIKTIKGKAVPPPSNVINYLKKGVTMRNHVVHGRASKIEHDTVIEILKSVQDVLYLLDYYNGYDWALYHLRTQTRADLGVE